MNLRDTRGRFKRATRKTIKTIQMVGAIIFTAGVAFTFYSAFYPTTQVAVADKEITWGEYKAQQLEKIRNLPSFQAYIDAEVEDTFAKSHKVLLEEMQAELTGDK